MPVTQRMPPDTPQMPDTQQMPDTPRMLDTPRMQRRASFQELGYAIRHLYQTNLCWKSVTAKLLVISYLLGFWLWGFLTSVPKISFFKYLTFWGWTLELLYFVFTLYLDLRARSINGTDQISPLSLAAAQALSEVAFAVQVVIVVFFWFVVYPREPHRIVWWECNLHGAGLVFIILDYVYRFANFSLRNHKYVMLFIFFYGFSHFMFVYMTGETIYPGLHFQDWFSIFIFLSAMAVCVYTHKVVYLMTNWSRLRDEMKTTLGILDVIFRRRDSLDDRRLKALISELGTEVLSLRDGSPTPAVGRCRDDLQFFPDGSPRERLRQPPLDSPVAAEKPSGGLKID